MRKATHKSNWVDIPLGKILSLEYGKSFPEKKRRPGPYAVYGSNGEIGRAHQYLLEEPTIIVGRKGSAGEINWAEPKSWPIDTTYFINVTDGRVHSIDFIYYLFKWLDPRRFIDTTTKPGLNRDRVYEQIVAIPPIPVQERIVQILEKADEVRRKRKDALELAEAILPSIFHDTFECNGSAWPQKNIREIAITRSGGTPSRKKQEYWSGPIPWVSPSDMKVTEIHDSEEHISEEAVDESATNLVEPSTILIVVRSGILAHTFPVAITSASVTFNQDIRALLPRKEILIPEYLLWALKARAPHVLMSIVKRGSTVHSIDSNRFFDMTIPVPPIAVQRTFVNQVEQLVAASQELSVGASDSESLFDSLLARAFTGELTAEWESVNADWIARQNELQDRLPRLLLLAFIQERLARAEKAAQAAVLVTALMKYAFLFQMEGNGRRRYYQFVPYHYGPFAKEIYDDLERLRADGLVSVENDTEEDKTRLTLVDPSKAEAALADFPDDLKEDVTAILDAYGDLDHNALLKTVYEKYPAYAKKSRVHKKKKDSSGRSAKK